MSIQHLKSLIDFTSLTCISKSDIQQGIETAQPYPHQGMVIWQSTAPDVVTNSELATFLWGKTADDVDYVPTGDFYFYNGSSWEEITLIDGSKLADGSVSLTKLSLTGSTPYFIIQVNSLGTALQWVSVINAIVNNTLPVAKLVSPDSTNNYVLVSLAGVKSFATPTDFVTNVIVANTVPVAKLVPGAANALREFLSTKVDGSGTEWVTLDIARLYASGFNANEVAKRNAANNGWEGYNLLTPREVYGFDSLPLSGGGGSPKTMDITLTKPTGRTWTTFEIACHASLDNNAVGGTVVGTFEWRTTPLTGVALANGASVGAGNGAESFVVNTNDDSVAPCWRYFGIVPDDLKTTDSIVIRVTLTYGSLAFDGANAYAKGVYA